MYVCAQRVAQPLVRGGAEGINAFYYVHKQDPWSSNAQDPVLPEVNPGVLMDSLIEVPPPGNDVRVYLDIVAPDSASFFEVLRAIGRHPAPMRFPVEWSSDKVWCRSGVEAALESHWESELEQLMARIVILLVRQLPA
jgi:hypothetical protein